MQTSYIEVEMRGIEDHEIAAHHPQRSEERALCDLVYKGRDERHLGPLAAQHPQRSEARASAVRWVFELDCQRALAKADHSEDTVGAYRLHASYTELVQLLHEYDDFCAQCV